MERLPATATLAAVTLLLTVLMALPLGIMAAVRRDYTLGYRGNVFFHAGCFHSQLLAGTDI